MTLGKTNAGCKVNPYIAGDGIRTQDRLQRRVCAEDRSLIL